MIEPSVHKPLRDVLDGKRQTVPPVWMMRQAGRYLPEYRAVREKAGSFLNLCFNPEMAAEVTLQPIRRFGFDAAILFSDILVIPHALGQTVRFVEGEGPRLDPIPDAHAARALGAKADGAALAPIYETVKRVRADCPRTCPLIGFCGAPWTVPTYMVAGRGTPDQAPAKELRRVIQKVRNSGRHTGRGVGRLCGEGARRQRQVFGRSLTPGRLHCRRSSSSRWCVQPIKKLVAAVRAKKPDTKSIGFPRGAGTGIPRYVDGVRRERGQPGNLDRPGVRTEGSSPACRCRAISLRKSLRAGGDALDRGGA